MIGVRKLQRSWAKRASILAVLPLLLVLSGCSMPASAFPNGQAQVAAAAEVAAETGSETQAETTTKDAQESHMAAPQGEPKTELALESPIALDLKRGEEIGSIFEAFLSPQQEGGEEEDTPSIVPDIFKSTVSSVSRNERPSHGHGVLSFTNDLSKAYVHVAIADVKVEEIVMFHIHCGRPGQLGPIIVDFALMGDLQDYWADNVLALEVTNEDIVATANQGEGLTAALTAGCPIAIALPADKVKTVAGLATIAREGELYFNLHTKGQTYFGDIRGQLFQVMP